MKKYRERNNDKPLLQQKLVFVIIYLVVMNLSIFYKQNYFLKFSEKLKHCE